MPAPHETNAIGGSKTEARAGRARLLLVTLIIGIVFMIMDARWSSSTDVGFSLTADEIVSQIASGGVARRVGYSAIGLLGVVLLVWPNARRRHYYSSPLVLMAGFLLVSFASIAWSDDPALTVRRLVTLIFCILAILGLIHQFSAQDLLKMALLTSGLFLVIGFIAEISLATFKPWVDDYRFSGVLHPNWQAAVCSILALGAFCRLKDADQSLWLYFALFITATFFLILTKSRTSVAGVCLALYLTAFWGSSSATKTLLTIGFPFAVSAVITIALLAGAEITRGLEQASQLGREVYADDLISLNGRIQLWTYLFDYIAQRPLLGYGYHGFWNSERVLEISEMQGWPIVHAHNVMIDWVLAVGLPATLTLLAGIGLWFRHLVRFCLVFKSSGAYFSFAMAVYAVISSLLESILAYPTAFASFIVVTIMAYPLLQPWREFARQTSPMMPAGHDVLNGNER